MILHAQFTWAVLTVNGNHYISLDPYVHTGSGTQEVSTPMAVWEALPRDSKGSVFAR
jgi:hypothetical protein